MVQEAEQALRRFKKNGKLKIYSKQEKLEGKIFYTLIVEYREGLIKIGTSTALNNTDEEEIKKNYNVLLSKCLIKLGDIYFIEHSKLYN